MEPFVNVFFSIDKAQNEEISLEELRQYVKENHLDEMMVQRWQALFDSKNTGRITFANFCDGLGLKLEEARNMRAATQSQSLRLHPDIVVLSAKMLLEDQVKIGEQTRLNARMTDKFNPDNATKQLKQWLDQTYGPAWQVVIVKGSHWITFSYCPNNSFQFRLYDYTYLIWRTPNTELAT